VQLGSQRALQTTSASHIDYSTSITANGLHNPTM